MHLRNEELVLFWITLFLYVLGCVLQLFAFATDKQRPAKWGLVLLWAGMACHTATGIPSWKRPPSTGIGARFIRRLQPHSGDERCS